MMMPGRKVTAQNGYRYGFNGKENDNELKGEGNEQDYGMRVYDPRLGRFLSVDALTKKYPELTPYQFASNTPIQGIDLDGLEVYYASNGSLIGKVGTNTQVRLVSADYPTFIIKQNIEHANSNNNFEKAWGEESLKANSTDVGMTNEELNTRAFLTTVRQAENANENKEPLAYNKIYGGSTFDDYSKHPQKTVTKWGRSSDAAGAYQFKYASWKMVKGRIGATDFSPQAQDKGALELIKLQNTDNTRANGVVDDIKEGNIEAAGTKLNGTWSSLPGGNEQQMTLEELKAQFQENIAKELKGNSSIATPKGQLKL